MMITKTTQAYSSLVLWSAGTFLSCIRRSLIVVVDFHDKLEIMISHAIIVVFHAHMVITVGLQAALRVPPAVTRLTVYRRLHITRRAATV